MAMKIGKEGKEVVKAITKKTKEVAKPASKEGIATNFIGYLIAIPLSFFYDFVYNLVAKKFIENKIATDVIRIALPATVGLIFHVGKLPVGDQVAGVGYGIAVISAVRVVAERLKLGGLFTKKKDVVKAGAVEAQGLNIMTLWGVE